MMVFNKMETFEEMDELVKLLKALKVFLLNGFFLFTTFSYGFIN